MSIPLLSATHLITLMSSKGGLQGGGSARNRPDLRNEITEFEACSEGEYRCFLATRVLSCATSFLQSSFWGQFKSGQGWEPHYFCGRIRILEPSKEPETCEFAFLVLSRSLLPAVFPALFSLAYIPFGPVFFTQGEGVRFPVSESWNPFVDSRGYFAACRLIGQKLLGYIPLSCFFVRLDSHYLARWGRSSHPEEQADRAAEEEPGGEQQAARDMGFYQARQRIQVPDTVLLDLCASEEKLLAGMHKKHRYNIRLAHKKEVRVCCVSWKQGLEEWYRLYQVTARRDKIGVHNFAYYRDLFELLEEDTEAHLFLYLAYGPQDLQEGETLGVSLGGIIVLHYAGTATYMYGASSNEGRELMPNYLLQWQAICQARTAGLLCYDFFGIPPHADPQHPLYGLYRFKVGFGGCLIQRCGAWDLAYGKVFYGMYRLLEWGRLWLYRHRHSRH